MPCYLILSNAYILTYELTYMSTSLIHWACHTMAHIYLFLCLLYLSGFMRTLRGIHHPIYYLMKFNLKAEFRNYNNIFRKAISKEGEGENSVIPLKCDSTKISLLWHCLGWIPFSNGFCPNLFPGSEITLFIEEKVLCELNASMNLWVGRR